MKADLHAHVPQGYANVNKVVDTASSRLSPKGLVVIANFNELDRYEPLIAAKGYSRYFTSNGSACYFPEQNLWIIKGAEPMAKLDEGEGEILGIGIPKGARINYQKPIQDTIKEIKDLGGKIIIVHPGLPVGSTAPYFLKHPEQLENAIGIEAYNQEGQLFRANATTRQILKKLAPAIQKYHLGLTAGSDAHYPFELGLTYSKWDVFLPFDEDSDRFIQNLEVIIRNSPRIHAGGKIAGPAGSGMHIAKMLWHKVRQN